MANLKVKISELPTWVPINTDYIPFISWWITKKGLKSDLKWDTWPQWPTWATWPIWQSNNLWITVSKTNHWFWLLQPVYFDWTNWQLAKADNIETLATYIVSEIINSNTCKIINIGIITIAGHWLSIWEYYFTSADVAWQLVLTSPALSNPILQVLDLNTIIVLNYRPISESLILWNTDWWVY